MNRDREYIVAGIEALLAKAKAEVTRLEAELQRRAPKGEALPLGWTTQAKVANKAKTFVRSAKARENMRKAQLARYAKMKTAKAPAKASAK